MVANLSRFNAASLFPPATRQLLNVGLQALQSTQAFSVGSSGLGGISGRSANPFSLADPQMLNNIDPFTAVSLATAIGGLPPQAQSQSPGVALLGGNTLNNINPMNAVALATALAGPLLPARQGGLLA